MKQYLLSVMHSGDYPTPAPEVMEQMFAQVDAFNRELQDSGAWVLAGGLVPRSGATTVRWSDGRAQVTDGPSAATGEQMGGFWVVQAEDLDAALDLAQRASAACMGDVELRAFQEG